MKKHHLAALALFATAASWGATFTLVKSVIARIAPEPFIFWRFLTASVILLIAARRRLSRKLIVPGIVLGTLIFIAYISQTRGLLTISPSRSAFLTGLYVVLVPFLQRERAKRNAWIAALLAVVGTTVLVGGDFDARASLGDLLTLVCAVVSAFHVIFTARWSTQETSIALAAMQIVFVTIATAPFAFFAHPTPWDRSIVFAILFTAVVTTALAFAALMWGQAHVSATEAAVILSFEPVAAAITSIAFYGEPLTLAFGIGAALILAAMVLSQL